MVWHLGAPLLVHLLGVLELDALVPGHCLLELGDKLGLEARELFAKDLRGGFLSPLGLLLGGSQVIDELLS